MLRKLTLCALLATFGCSEFLQGEDRATYMAQVAYRKEAIMAFDRQMTADYGKFYPKVVLPNNKKANGRIRGKYLCSPAGHRAVHNASLMTGTIESIGFIPKSSKDLTVNQMAHGGGALIKGGSASNVVKTQEDLYISVRPNSIDELWTIYVQKQRGVPPPAILLTRLSKGQMIQWPMTLPTIDGGDYGRCFDRFSFQHPTLMNPRDGKLAAYHVNRWNNEFHVLQGPLVTLNTHNIEGPLQ